MFSLTFQPVRLFARSFPLSDNTTRPSLRRVAARTIRLARRAGHEVYTIIPGRVWDIEPGAGWAAEPAENGGRLNGMMTLAAA